MTDSLGRVVTLIALRDKYRPLLIFTPSTANPLYEQQLALLQSGRDQLQDRQVLLVPILDDGPAPGGYTQLTRDEEQRARRRFQVKRGEFAVILLGKDGGEKLRRSAPVTLDALRALIDAMPMRQREQAR